MRVKWGFTGFSNCTTEIVRDFSPKITKSDSFQYADELMTKVLVLVCISMGSRELVRNLAIFLVFFHRKSKVNTAALRLSNVRVYSRPRVNSGTIKQI